MNADADGIFSGKRLVIFGCGYVGAEVARQAVARGVRATALTRNAAKAEVLRAEGVEAIVADLASDEWHGRIAGGADFVLNCVSSGGGGVEGYVQSYLRGTESILAWARETGKTGTLVYTSSTSVYPQGGGATIDETAATDRINVRPKVLVETEDLVGTAGEARSRPAAGRWFVLRLAGIYGPGRSHLLEQVRTGEVAGHGAHRLNLAHRDDIAAAIWAAFGAPGAVRNGIFNVADDGPTPKGEVVAWLASRLGVPPPRFTGEPMTGRRAITPDRAISNAKIKRELGWRPRFPTFREGYEKMLSR
jgi:nucleoside-diphosphate-sugar epimerase